MFVPRSGEPVLGPLCGEPVFVLRSGEPVFVLRRGSPFPLQGARTPCPVHTAWYTLPGTPPSCTLLGTPCLPPAGSSSSAVIGPCRCPSDRLLGSGLRIIMGERKTLRRGLSFL